MKIAPSVLSADFLRLGEQLEEVESAGADYIHIDIMDGIFVPNISVGFPVIKSMRKATKLPFDVHLMIEHPLLYVKRFSEYAQIISFHIETKDDIDETIEAIKEGGAKPALVIKPNTPVEELLPFIDKVYMVLVMTVEPGFGRQKLIPETLEKVRFLKEKRPQLVVEVDGGVNINTISACKDAGVDICVAGSAVFLADDIKETVKALKSV